MKTAILILLAASCHAACTDGWNRNFRYSQRVTVTNAAANVGITPTHTVDLAFNHAALVAAGKSLASGADVNLRYCDGTNWTLLDRVLDISTAWNTATTRVSWRVQSSIAPSAADAGYSLSYGNPTAPLPFRTVTTPNVTREQIKAKADSIALINHTTFSSDGTDLWTAGVIYTSMYAGDTYYTIHGNPGLFSAAQIKNVVQKFVTAVRGDGNLPEGVSPTGAAIGIAGWNTDQFRPSVDPIAAMVELESVYHARTGDNVFFASISPVLKVAMNNIPLDGVTHLVNISSTVGQRWNPYLFMDGTLSTGNHLMGSLMLFKAAKILSQRYSDVGDAANATAFATMAGNVSANLPTLWNAGDGMFHAATGNNNQIDILGSSLAVYLNTLYPGLIDSGKVTSISTYLVSNYATLVNANGYIRESPSNWAVTWGGNMAGYGAGNYDDGYWSVGHEWVATAMAQTSPAKAVQLIADLANGTDLGVECYGSSVNGTSQNMESPQGALAFVTSNPSLFPDSTSTAALSNDANNVYWLFDDFSGVKSWTPNHGTWAISGGVMRQTATVIDTLTPDDTKHLLVSHLADGMTAQSDIRIDSLSAGDHSTAGVCLSVQAPLAIGDQGDCVCFRSNDSSTVNLLQTNRAWGVPSAFPWSVGTWYRSKIARVGLNLSRKTWAVGSAEPGAWDKTFTLGTIWSDTDQIALLSGFSTTSYDNVIVRKLLSTEPTVSAAAEVTVAARHRSM